LNVWDQQPALFWKKTSIGSHTLSFNPISSLIRQFPKSNASELKMALGESVDVPASGQFFSFVVSGWSHRHIRRANGLCS
jgi:hypothetical protein